MVVITFADCNTRRQFLMDEDGKPKIFESEDDAVNFAVENGADDMFPMFQIEEVTQ